MVTLMDRFAAGYSILFAVFFETIAVSWAYGLMFITDIFPANFLFEVASLYFNYYDVYIDPCVV